MALSDAPIPSQTHLNTHSRPQTHTGLQGRTQPHVHLYFHCSGLTHTPRPTHTSSYTYILTIPGTQSHIHHTLLMGLHSSSEICLSSYPLLMCASTSFPKDRAPYTSQDVYGDPFLCADGSARQEGALPRRVDQKLKPKMGRWCVLLTLSCPCTV